MLPEVHLKQPTAEEFRDRFLYYLRYTCGLELRHARPADHLIALGRAVRESIIDREILTRRTYDDVRPKMVHYLSMEYLLGRLMTNNLIATGLFDTAREAMQMLGLNVDTIMQEESDPGLGNGGLGRLAACFLDSLATLDYPAYGHGLRYDYGMFRQNFENGWQVEHADTWLEDGFPWEVVRNDRMVPVRFGGQVDWSPGKNGGTHRPTWGGWRQVYGIPHDVLVAGYGTNTVTVLRLWDARAASEFDFHIFSRGGFVQAVEERERVEAVNRVLYPADDVEAGRRLRLTQEYFLVACSVRDAMERFRHRHGEVWEMLPDKVSLQLNDTHPALTVAELMRFLLDEAGLSWSPAWELTKATCSYTNHTLLPEALETWPVSLMEPLIPRHVQIIYEINRRFMDSVKTIFSDRPEALRRMSILQEDGDKRLRMANLAIVGSHRVNGVAKLHTRTVADAGGQGLRRSVAGEVPPDHQRRHATPLAAGLQSAPGKADLRPHRRHLAARARPTSANSMPSPTTTGSRTSSWPSRPPTNGTCQPRSTSCAGSGSIRSRCTTSRSSACTNTSASFSTSCTSSIFTV